MDCGRSPGLTFSIYVSGRRSELRRPNLTPSATPRTTCGTRAARKDKCPPAAAPDHAGNVGASRRSEKGKGKGRAHGGQEVEPKLILNHPTEPSWSELRGTKAARWPPATAPAAETRRFRLMTKRPSDRRSPRRNLGPQSAFEVSMINVSCNSH